MKKTILITGGAGFIGINASEKFLQDGWEVIILDNISRAGSVKNLAYLEEKYPHEFEFIKADIRQDTKQLRDAVAKSQVILHLAGQVAVTTSVENPSEDFEINALGALNILETARKAGHKPLIIYSSTNKVYGRMEDVDIIEEQKRYRYADLPFGVSENRNLDFHSPYGCSKGAADQYFRDYSRIFDIPTVVFRQSCIYGPRQFGVEDQGWIAWFIIATLIGKPITIFGDGKQVRDVLFVDDLVALYKIAAENPITVKGKIYNVGGGSRYTLSLLELVDHLEEIYEKEIPLKFSDWRPGDQPVYVSDIRKIHQELGWSPEITTQDGIRKLAEWAKENKELF